MRRGIKIGSQTVFMKAQLTMSSLLLQNQYDLLLGSQLLASAEST